MEKNLILYYIIALCDLTKHRESHKPVRVGESYDNTNFFRLFCLLILFAAQLTTSRMLDRASFIIFPH